MSFSEKNLITSDNLRIYYRQYGIYNPEKPIILCLSGLTRNSKSFHRYAMHCLEMFDACLICPDMRGRGQSAHDHIPLNYNLFRETQDIIEIINHENITKMMILGTSRGGMQAGILASMIPDKIKAVILNDIGVTMPMSALLRLGRLFSMHTDFIGDYQKALALFYAGDNGMTKNLSSEQEYDIIHELFNNNDGVYTLDYDYKGMGEAYQASLIETTKLNLAYCDLRPLFMSLQNIPVLLLHGENSDILTLDDVATTQKFLPHIQYHAFADRGHVLYFNEQKAIAVCNQFIEQYL